MGLLVEKCRATKTFFLHSFSGNCDGCSQLHTALIAKKGANLTSCIGDRCFKLLLSAFGSHFHKSLFTCGGEKSGMVTETRRCYAGTLTI